MTSSTELDILLKEHARLSERMVSLDQTGRIINISGAIVFSASALLGARDEDATRILVAIALPILWSGLLLYSQVLQWDTTKYGEYMRAVELKINAGVGRDVVVWESKMAGRSESAPPPYKYFFWFWIALISLTWIISISSLWLTGSRITAVYGLAAFQTAVAAIFGLAIVRILRGHRKFQSDFRRRSEDFLLSGTRDERENARSQT